MEGAEIHLILGPRKRSVQGDSKASGFEKSIDISDWGFGVSAKEDSSKSATGRPGDAQGSGNKADITDIQITKQLDRSSTTLTQLVASGDELSHATLEMVHRVELSSGFRLRMADVRLTSYTITATSTDTHVELTEVVVLSFNKIRIEYGARISRRLGRDSGGATRSFEYTQT